MSDSTASQDEIEQGLERTRSRMDSRLSELQGRLSPGQILDDLMGYFRGSEGGDFARNLVASVKSNPVPAALTGISLAWLMAANPRPQTELSGDRVSTRVAPAVPNGRSGMDDLEQRVRNAEQNVARQPDDTDATYSMRVDDARGAVVGVKRGAHDTAQSLGQRIQDALTAAKTTASEAAGNLRDQAGSAVGQLASSAHGVGEQIAQGSQSAQAMGSNVLTMVASNPVLLGAIGLAAGALLGALIPQSEQEETALAGVAGQARDTARNLGQEVMDRGGQVAQKVLDTGRDSAREHGLTADKSIGDVVEGLKSGDLAGTVKQVAQDVLKLSDEAFRKDGLNTDASNGGNGSANS